MAASGSTSIEDVQPGDKVWSYDQEKQEWVLSEVEQVQSREYVGDIITLEVTLEDGSTETIECTGSHPFWVTAGENLDDRPAALEVAPDERRMTTDSDGGRWTEARWLKIGDHFLTRTGKSATVTGLTIRTERVRVYNLEVQGDPNYAVGNTGILVHNACPLNIKKVVSTSESIADGTNIRDVNRLVREYGGKAKNWRKRKGWDEDGTEWHWYENLKDNCGRKEWKPK